VIAASNGVPVHTSVRLFVPLAGRAARTLSDSDASVDTK